MLCVGGHCVRSAFVHQLKPRILIIAEYIHHISKARCYGFKHALVWDSSKMAGNVFYYYKCRVTLDVQDY